MNNTGKIIMAFASGAAAGAILGILFAPSKGSKTRKRLKEEGMKIVDSVEENIRKGKEKLEHLRHDFERKFNEEMEPNMTHSR